MTEPLRLRVAADRSQKALARRQALRDRLGMVERPPPQGVRTLDRIRMRVHGVASRGDARRLERRLAGLDGVEQARVRFEDDAAMVAVFDGRVSEDDVRYVVRAAGFDAWIEEEDPHTPREQRDADHRRLVRNAWSTLLPAALLLGSAVAVRDLGLGTERVRQLVVDAQLLVVAAVFWLGRDLFATTLWEGWRGARRDLPLGLAALVALLASLWAFFTDMKPWFDVAGAIVATHHAGAFLESWLQRRAEQHLDRVVALRPRWAIVRREDQDVRIAIRDLESSDVVVVRPGEIVPVDGILSGTELFLVDEADILGEGTAQQKRGGDRVFAGTTNTGVELLVKPERRGARTALGRMLEVIEAARTTRAPVQTRWDRIGALLAPITLLLALATFVAWRVIEPSAPLWHAVSPALAVLIAATPWALGWAGALPVTAGMTQAARLGVLLRDAGVLEAIRSLDTVVFGKAGTLTLDQPELESFEVFGSSTVPQDALRMLMAVESRSDHPLGRACEEYAVEQFGAAITEDLPEPRSFREIPGRGVIARVDEAEVCVGSAALLDGKGIDYPEEPHTGTGASLYLAVDGRLRARAQLFDPLREDALANVRRVRQAGARPMMVSAGSVSEAARVAGLVGIDPADVRAGIDTAEHAEVVRVLRAAGRVVGVVGDSESAQPTLAAADVGFGLVADGAMPDDPWGVLVLRPGAGGVITAWDLAVRAFRTIRGNIAVAVASMLLSIPAALGLLPPLAALLVLLGTVAFVGANGLRIQAARWRPGAGSSPS